MPNKTMSVLYQKVTGTLDFGLRSNIAKNAASLYLIQFAQYILPLITIPYLLNVLGPSGYGLVAFGQSLMVYFIIITDFGFLYSATRKISLERDDTYAVSSTACNVWATKALLGLAGFVVLLSAVILIPKLHETMILFLILYGIVIGNVLFPTWLYQGMEKMVAISVINLFLQLFLLVGIFTFLHKAEDYVLYAVLLSVSSILSGLVGLVVAFRIFKLRLTCPSRQGIVETFRDGWVLFLSMASVSLYTAGNAFILGLLTNTTIVGYYSIAEKIVKAILSLLGVISQVVYPAFSKMATESKTLTLQWGRKMVFIMGCIGLILSVMTCIAAPFIVHYIIGPQYEPSILAIQILSIILFAVSVSNVLGIQLMVALRHDRAFTLMVFSAGLLNIILAIILAPIWQAAGMALAVALSEILIVIVQLLYMQSKYSFIDILIGTRKLNP